MRLSLREIFLLACIVFSTFGCAQQHLFCDIPEHYLAMPADQIKEEISLLEKRIAAGPGSSTQEKLLPEDYYNLALLYSHHNNASPDYSKALKALDRYTRNIPPHRKEYDVIYLENLLKDLEGLVQIKKGYVQLQGEHIELEENYAELRRLLDELIQEYDNLMQEHGNLIQEHRDTKETLEQLKRLDIWLEQKKREIK
ncbi:MAG: hypothetical protein ACLFV2_01285 [Desulfurivibrionaceae bacterium]